MDLGTGREGDGGILVGAWLGLQAAHKGEDWRKHGVLAATWPCTFGPLPHHLREVRREHPHIAVKQNEQISLLIRTNLHPSNLPRAASRKN
jgi:hypothetical protein